MVDMRLENITYSIQDGSKQRSLFNRLNLSISAGEKVLIQGVSGSGKTTLLGILSGLTIPQQGNVIWQKESILGLSKSSKERMRAMLIGMVCSDLIS